MQLNDRLLVEVAILLNNLTKISFGKTGFDSPGRDLSVLLGAERMGATQLDPHYYGCFLQGGRARTDFSLAWLEAA